MTQSSLSFLFNCVVAIIFIASTAVGFTRIPARSVLLQRNAEVRKIVEFRMSDEPQADEEQVVSVISESEEEESETPGFGSKGFFMPNSNLRYGSSRDQDGKSNVWAVEPKMNVEEGENKTTSIGVGLGILIACGAAVALTISNLPSPDTY